MGDQSSSSRSDAVRIKPLDGSNYINWKFNVQLVLMDKDLWGFIEGTETKPVATETDKKETEIKEYIKRSRKAYTTIALSIHKSLQVHVKSTQDPKKAWDALKAQFDFVSVSQIVRLCRTFYAATMDENDDMLDHITYMTTLADQLRELGEDVTSRKFATTVLGSLPESYQNFITSLNARDANTLEWESVKKALMEESMSRKDKREKQQKEDALFMGRGSHSSRGKFRSQQSHNHYDNKPAGPPQPVDNQNFGRNTSTNRGGHRNQNFNLETRISNLLNAGVVVRQAIKFGNVLTRTRKK